MYNILHYYAMRRYLVITLCGHFKAILHQDSGLARDFQFNTDKFFIA